MRRHPARRERPPRAAPARGRGFRGRSSSPNRPNLPSQAHARNVPGGTEHARPRRGRASSRATCTPGIDVQRRADVDGISPKAPQPRAHFRGPMPPATMALARRTGAPYELPVEIAPVPPSALSKRTYRRRGPQWLPADTQRRPDFALAGKLPTQSADIFDVLVAVQLNRVEVQQHRDVGDHAQGASRNTPTGNIPDLRAVPASGAASRLSRGAGCRARRRSRQMPPAGRREVLAPQFNPHSFMRPKISSRAA